MLSLETHLSCRRQDGSDDRHVGQRSMEHVEADQFAGMLHVEDRFVASGRAQHLVQH